MSEQATTKHAEDVQVIVQDIETKEILCYETIKRAKLAKLFHENRIVGAKLGLFVIER